MTAAARRLARLSLTTHTAAARGLLEISGYGLACAVRPHATMTPAVPSRLKGWHPDHATRRFRRLSKCASNLCSLIPSSRHRSPRGSSAACYWSVRGMRACTPIANITAALRAANVSDADARKPGLFGPVGRVRELNFSKVTRGGAASQQPTSPSSSSPSARGLGCS